MTKGKRNDTGPSARNLAIYERAAINRERYAGIAQDHSISIGRVSQIVGEVNTAMIPGLLDRINEQRVEQTAALNGMIVEAMDAWRKSKSVDAGDPRYLDVVRKCMGDIRRIWGSEAETIQRAPEVPEEKSPPALVQVVIETYDEYQEYLRMIEFKEVDDLILDVQSRRAETKSTIECTPGA